MQVDLRILGAMRKHRAGFTLSEILVVMAVLIVLATFGFSVLSQVREGTGRTVCQNNLRQIALALQQYAQDHHGKYRKASGYALVSPAYCILQGWQPAALQSGLNESFFICPAIADHTRFHEYTFNFGGEPVILSPMLPPYIATFPPELEESFIVNAATTWMLREVQGEPDKHMPLVTSACNRSRYWNSRHRGGSNYAFFDGHVKWLTPQSIGEIDCMNPPALIR